MSELMTPIPFRELMTWVTAEYQKDGTVFGVHKPYKAGVKTLPIFGEKIETPFGPAAGPNTQLAQNIIAGYFAGARFFELKTVQKMDGADLAACISRPCILAEDECYNCEWSTELYVQQAFEEYVKAWCACKIMAKVYGLGDPDAFVFNMSVGYDLEGIQGPKVDKFLTEMVDASKTPIFQECIRVLKEFFPAESAFIDAIVCYQRRKARHAGCDFKRLQGRRYEDCCRMYLRYRCFRREECGNAGKSKDALRKTSDLSGLTI